MSSSYKLKLERLLNYVLEKDASDIHFNVGRPPTIRVDRKLIIMEGEDVLTPDDTVGLVEAFLTEEQKDRFEKQMELDLSFAFSDKARFRINVFHQKGFVGAALRLIPNKIRTIEELGLPPIIKDFANDFQGLVLMVGPTGHGKSTTLASLLDVVNHNRAEHIITIEDPIEYLLTQDKSIINQRELNQDTMSFARALRSVLREDGDVVMVGEMRDLDTISSTITVAETGHLVFATLHTNSAAQTVDRIVDAFPSYQQNQVKAQFASIISGVISQRLIPRIGGGRVVAAEVLVATSAVRNLIREGKAYQLDGVIQTSAEDGMISLDNSLAELVRAQQITMNDAMMYALDQKNLSALLES
ncbi:MAG: hypothetical protein ACD_63C00026G0003 [uncultured bacterium]|nr:MAG: hypothetical protein ACD_63C00026G0003 [uncultured bacterium]